MARLSMPAANIEKFLSFVASATAAVREQELGRVTAYDFAAVDSDLTHCCVYEEYFDAAAFVTHLENLGEKAAAALDIFSVEQMVIMGELPTVVVDQLKAFAGPRLSYYGRAISRL